MLNSVSRVEDGGISAVLDQEVAAIAAGDAASYVATLAEDAVFMPPNLPAKMGAQLQSWLGEFLQQVMVQWLALTHVDTVVAGDLAYHVFACSWRVTPKPQGDPKVLHFKGLHILRRNPSGEWKISREIWNTNPEAWAEI